MAHTNVDSTEFEQLKRQIEELQAEVKRRTNGWRSWSQLFLSIVIMPWSVWTTHSIYTQSAALQRIQDWQNVSPRFTPTDGENLRLKILQESAANYNLQVGIISEKIAALKGDMAEVKSDLKSLQKNRP